MKVLFTTFAVICASLILYRPTVEAGVSNLDDFSKLTFEVNLEKDNYVLSEPFTVNFSVINNTKSPISSYTPVFLQECELEVDLDGKIKTFRNLSNITGKPMRFLSTLSANQRFNDEGTFGPSFSELFFPAPGKYSIRFRLKSPDAEKSIVSNTVEIRIDEPTNLNLKAFEFLKSHEKYFGLSSWQFHGKEAVELLERFTFDFGESAYGEFAITELAYTYLTRGELDRAKATFTKVLSSRNRRTAEDAKKAVIDIENRLLQRQ